MLRRTLLAGFVASLATPALAKKIDCIACVDYDTIYTVYNKVGLPVTYSKAMAADLWTIYGIDIKKIIPNMMGTEFKISNLDSLKDQQKKYGRMYMAHTNNKKDGVFAFHPTNEQISNRKDRTEIINAIFKSNQEWNTGKRKLTQIAL